MKLFEQLGTRIETLWREVHSDEQAFSAIAARALNEVDGLADLTVTDILHWVLTQPDLPPQFDPKSTFGEPPITLWNRSRFVIDLYFWLDGTTAIHQHSFSGVFHVLGGSSIHTQYRWTPQQRLNAQFQLGELTCENVELLERGKSRRIEASNRFIHALFHLERPSCTLVVRTHRDDIGPQLTYLPPSLGYDPERRDPLHDRKREIIRMAQRVDHPDWRQMTHRLLGEVDFPTAFQILSDTLMHVKSEAALQPFIDSARARFRAYVDTIVPVFDEMIRQREIIDKRNRIFDADHRFFLALLLNVPTRREIDALIDAKYPGVPAHQMIHRWLTEIAAQRVEGTSENVLGVPLDETSLTIFESLVRGMSDPAVCDRMLAEYDCPPDERESAQVAIVDMCQAFRSSVLFARLFR